jgi:hypothetical protein
LLNLPGRVGGLCERGRGVHRAVGEIAFRRGAQRRFVGLKFRGEIALKAMPIAGVESAQRIVQLARDQRAGRFTAFRQQCRCQQLRALERCRLCAGQAA